MPLSTQLHYRSRYATCLLRIRFDLMYNSLLRPISLVLPKKTISNAEQAHGLTMAQLAHSKLTGCLETDVLRSLTQLFQCSRAQTGCVHRSLPPCYNALPPCTSARSRCQVLGKICCCTHETDAAPARSSFRSGTCHLQVTKTCPKHSMAFTMRARAVIQTHVTGMMRAR